MTFLVAPNQSSIKAGHSEELSSPLTLRRADQATHYNFTHIGSIRSQPIVTNPKPITINSTRNKQNDLNIYSKAFGFSK